MPNPENVVKHKWKKGSSPFADWWHAQSPLEQQKHLEQRKARKDAKKQFKTLIEATHHSVLTKLYNGTMKALQNAEITGNTQDLERLMKMLSVIDNKLDITQDITVSSIGWQDDDA